MVCIKVFVHIDLYLFAIYWNEHDPFKHAA